jgi:hypothetical protein
MDALKPLLRYWSLTFAVFTFYLFAMLVALIDVVGELRDAARKKRAAAKAPALDPNPLAGVTVAQSVFPGPGQQLDTKREWVARLAAEIAGHINPPVKTLVLEDSKGHPLVHFSDGKRLETYRVDRTLVDKAMAGDAAGVAELKELLTRHLIADFLGTESVRPPRTTELAREAGAKPTPATPAAAARPATGSAPPTAAARPAPSPAPVDTESMSREERLAAAKARAEALRKERMGGQSDKPSS